VGAFLLPFYFLAFQASPFSKCESQNTKGYFMKKMFILSAALLCILLTNATNARAIGLSVGASTWYTQWSLSPPIQGSIIDPGLMFGPIAGIDFGNKWSLTSVFLTGNLIRHTASNMTMNNRREDSDTVINYSITKWLKVFGGLKYMKYTVNSDGHYISPLGDGEISLVSYGPALGVGVTIPVTDSLFALANISGIYLHGKQKQSGTDSLSMTQSGYNGTLALAYYFDSLSTTLNIGLRYQYYKTVYSDTSFGYEKNRFYGITASAVYHFDIGNSDQE
jgi:hypothetical protein